MSRPVLFEERAAHNGTRLAFATLNAEKTLNALSLEMIDLLAAKLTAWAADPAIAIVVLQAAGDKAFCAGGDLQNLYRSMVEHHASHEKHDVLANRYARDFFEREYRLDYLIHTYPKPILCWGHGIVMGGGIGLMAGASHRVVTERSRLAMPEISVGLYPDVGGTWFLNRMPGKLGLFLALTAASLNASDAKYAKLADYHLLHAQKQTVLDELQQQPWSAMPQQNHVLLGQVLRAAERHATTNETAQAAGPLRRHFDLINALCNYAALPEIFAAITQLQTDDPWLQKASAALTAGCPGSALLSHALQQRALRLSLAEVFRLEYVVSLHCAARPDFAEGIRALLIDKDQGPQWQPATLAEADPDWVDGFFRSPWRAAEHPLADLNHHQLAA